jgi:hypothetical protein
LLLDRRARWASWIYRASLVASGLVMSLSILGLVVENRDLRRSQECRFDISAESDAIGDRIDQATARGLRAVALGDDAALREQAAIIDEQTALLDPAIERKENAIEECG